MNTTTPLTISHLELLIDHRNKTTKFHLLSATKQKLASTLVARKLLESPDDDTLAITEQGLIVLTYVQDLFNARCTQ